jgi:hypothetical protein
LGKEEDGAQVHADDGTASADGRSDVEGVSKGHVVMHRKSAPAKRGEKEGNPRSLDGEDITRWSMERLKTAAAARGLSTIGRKQVLIAWLLD